MKKLIFAILFMMMPVMASAWTGVYTYQNASAFEDTYLMLNGTWKRFIRMNPKDPKYIAIEQVGQDMFLEILAPDGTQMDAYMVTEWRSNEALLKLVVSPESRSAVIAVRKISDTELELFKVSCQQRTVHSTTYVPLEDYFVWEEGEDRPEQAFVARKIMERLGCDDITVGRYVKLIRIH